MTVLSIASHIPGFITRSEGDWLAKHAAKGIALEIGAYLGRSTCYLAQMATRVVTCEPFCGQPVLLPHQRCVNFRIVRDSWHNNISSLGLQKKVDLVELKSRDAYQVIRSKYGPAFKLIFVDGSHYMQDLVWDVCYANLLRISGIIAFHDYGDPRFPEVTLAVAAWIRHMEGTFVEVGAPSRIKAFRRVSARACRFNWFTSAREVLRLVAERMVDCY